MRSPSFGDVLISRVQLRTACEKALQSLCAGNLDGQQPPLSQVLQACQHSEDVTQLKQELASKPAELAEPCPSQPETQFWPSIIFVEQLWTVVPLPFSSEKEQVGT